ncbi:MAG: ThuA domain-containing protein [Candidatus Brocadiae bacterium]|nr:ThuA domain-containing protein [Candidatus Brocadiia bacterium]
MLGKLACLALAMVLVAGVAAVDAADADGKIKVLVVTGGHGFNQKPFFKVYEDNKDIVFTKAAHTKKSATVYDRDDLLAYDVVVIYDMMQGITDAQKAKFLALIKKGTGVLVMHHALASFQDWPEYERIIGGKFLLRPETKDGVTTPKSGWGHEPVPVHVVSKEHPITAGLDDCTFNDEYYNKCRVSDQVTLLLTTDFEKNQRQVMWCREEGKARVVYLMSGHDQKVYNDPTYRKLVANAIRWVARK